MSKITTFKLYLGLNDKDTKIQKYNIFEASQMAKIIVLSQCDGATIYRHGSGIYKHEDEVEEQTLIIDISGVGKSRVAEIIEALKVAFNQERVLVEKTSSNRVFV